MAVANATQICMCKLVYSGLLPIQRCNMFKKSSLLGFSGFCVTVRGNEIPYSIADR
ncbi:MAG: hypothetical protein XXXJIFNMEKO3_02054 [Candidatus Erwinia impunctatus]|nr:hypothetical protein XXXJIFNMEKO_02054 [Culicoides impunctatus]